MRRYRIVPDDDIGNVTPLPDIMYAIGRVIGYVLMFGGGFVIGQVIRGSIMAILYGPVK